MAGKQSKGKNWNVWNAFNDDFCNPAVTAVGLSGSQNEFWKVSSQ